MRMFFAVFRLAGLALSVSGAAQQVLADEGITRTIGEGNTQLSQNYQPATFSEHLYKCKDYGEESSCRQAAQMATTEDQKRSLERFLMYYYSARRNEILNNLFSVECKPIGQSTQPVTKNHLFHAGKATERLIEVECAVRPTSYIADPGGITAKDLRLPYIVNVRGIAKGIYKVTKSDGSQSTATEESDPVFMEMHAGKGAQGSKVRSQLVIVQSYAKTDGRTYELQKYTASFAINTLREK